MGLTAERLLAACARCCAEGSDALWSLRLALRGREAVPVFSGKTGALPPSLRARRAAGASPSGKRKLLCARGRAARPLGGGGKAGLASVRRGGSDENDRGLTDLSDDSCEDAEEEEEEEKEEAAGSAASPECLACWPSLLSALHAWKAEAFAEEDNQEEGDALEEENQRGVLRLARHLDRLWRLALEGGRRDGSFQLLEKAFVRAATEKGILRLEDLGLVWAAAAVSLECEGFLSAKQPRTSDRAGWGAALEFEMKSLESSAPTRFLLQKEAQSETVEKETPSSEALPSQGFTGSAALLREALFVLCQNAQAAVRLSLRMSGTPLWLLQGLRENSSDASPGGRRPCSLSRLCLPVSWTLPLPASLKGTRDAPAGERRLRLQAALVSDTLVRAAALLGSSGERRREAFCVARAPSPLPHPQSPPPQAAVAECPLCGVSESQSAFPFAVFTCRANGHVLPACAGCLRCLSGRGNSPASQREAPLPRLVSPATEEGRTPPLLPSGGQQHALEEFQCLFCGASVCGGQWPEGEAKSGCGLFPFDGAASRSGRSCPLCRGPLLAVSTLAECPCLSNTFAE